MPTCFMIGQIFMLFAAPELERRKGQFWTPPLLLSLAYAFFVFVPLTGWYFYAYTGWSTVYLRPEHQIPFFAGPIILLMYFLGMFFGAALAQSLIQSGLKKIVPITLVCSVFWFGGILALTFDEYTHIGTYQQYMSGEASPIFQVPHFMNQLNLMGGALAAPAIVIAVYLYRRAKQVTPDRS